MLTCPDHSAPRPETCALCAVLWACDRDPVVRERTGTTRPAAPWVRAALAGTLPASDRTGFVRLTPAIREVAVR